MPTSTNFGFELLAVTSKLATCNASAQCLFMTNKHVFLFKVLTWVKHYLF